MVKMSFKKVGNICKSLICYSSCLTLSLLSFIIKPVEGPWEVRQTFFFFGYARMFLSFASIFPLIWSLFNLEMLNTDFVWKGLCKSVCSYITVLQVNSSVQFYCCCWDSFCLFLPAYLFYTKFCIFLTWLIPI